MGDESLKEVLSAKEMKEITNLNAGNKINKEIDEIYKLILKAANKGENVVKTSSNVSSYGVIKILSFFKEKGYECDFERPCENDSFFSSNFTKFTFKW